LTGSADLWVGRCWPKGQRYAETRTLLIAAVFWQQVWSQA